MPQRPTLSNLGISDCGKSATLKAPSGPRPDYLHGDGQHAVDCRDILELQPALGMAIVFVTHDVGAAAELSDRIAVMYAGRFVETSTTREIMRTPRHRYTQGLLASTVHGGLRGGVLETIPGAPPNLAQVP